jgi:hypothetical protein
LSCNEGRFVYFPYCVSLAVVTIMRPSDVYFIRAGKGAVLKGLPFTLISLGTDSHGSVPVYESNWWRTGTRRRDCLDACRGQLKRTRSLVFGTALEAFLFG